MELMRKISTVDGKSSLRRKLYHWFWMTCLFFGCNWLDFKKYLFCRSEESRDCESGIKLSQKLVDSVGQWWWERGGSGGATAADVVECLVQWCSWLTIRPYWGDRQLRRWSGVGGRGEGWGLVHRKCEQVLGRSKWTAESPWASRSTRENRVLPS